MEGEGYDAELQAALDKREAEERARQDALSKTHAIQRILQQFGQSHVPK